MSSASEAGLVFVADSDCGFVQPVLHGIVCTINAFDALSELLFNDAFLLIDFLLSQCLDPRIALLGAEDRTAHGIVCDHDRGSLWQPGKS